MPKIKYVKDNEWGTTFPNFRKNEFACPKHCNGFPSQVAYSLLEVMQNLRNKYGSIHVNSGVRCPQFNAELQASSAESDHLQGCACDWNFDSHIFGEQEKNEIMAYIRTLPNVKYTYTNQTNMFNGIHISVYPTYEKANITKFELSEIGTNYVKVAFETDEAVDFAMYSLNGLEYVNLPISNVIDNLKEGMKYTLSIKLRTQGTNEWTISDTLEFTTLKIEEETPQIQEKEEDSTNTPSNVEINENGTKKEELDHKVNPLVEFVKFLIEFIRKYFMKGDK